MNDLCVCIGNKFPELRATAKGHTVRGFWLILGGSATKLYSEGWVSMLVVYGSSFLFSFFRALLVPSRVY